MAAAAASRGRSARRRPADLRIVEADAAAATSNSRLKRKQLALERRMGACPPVILVQLTVVALTSLSLPPSPSSGRRCCSSRFALSPAFRFPAGGLSPRREAVAKATSIAPGRGSEVKCGERRFKRRMHGPAADSARGRRLQPMPFTRRNTQRQQRRPDLDLGRRPTNDEESDRRSPLQGARFVDAGKRNGVAWRCVAAGCLGSVLRETPIYRIFSQTTDAAASAAATTKRRTTTKETVTSRRRGKGPPTTGTGEKEEAALRRRST